MPRKRCADCEGQYGKYVWTEPERREWLPCECCAALRRERQARVEEQERIAAQEDLVEQAHRRQRQLEEDEFERQQRAAKEVRENKIAQKKIEADVQKSQHAVEEESKIRRFEADCRREIAQEETKQLEAKTKLEEAVSSRECLIAQEKTKQVKIEKEERTKQIVEEQRTIQMKEINETLSHCVKLTEQLRLAGSNKQVIEGVLKSFLGNSDYVQKVSSHFPKATPSEAQSKFLESINNQELPPRMSKPSHSARPRIHTAPVNIN